MLKREHIRQAIDTLGRRAPEIGYTLGELFDAGEIDVQPDCPPDPAQGDFYFRFQHRVVAVRRFLFINEGCVPIEQQLLIKYGELRGQQEFLERPGGIDYSRAAERTRMAGLQCLVDYEIELALDAAEVERASGPSASAADMGSGSLSAERLRSLRKTDGVDESIAPLGGDNPEEILFKGRLPGRLPAVFMPFPGCRQALLQLAALNLEFFHVRFVLNQIARGHPQGLFACLVRGYLAGLVYVGIKQQYFHLSLEIRYISAVRGRLPWLPGLPLRGIGSFLVAGAWMFWKTRLPDLRELLLDSEIGAVGFYRAIGFQRLRSMSFVLGQPAGALLDHLVVMADACANLPEAVVAEIAGFVRRQIRVMAHRAHPEEDKAAYRGVRHSLLCRQHALLATTAAGMLLRHRRRIPQADSLLRIGVEFGRLRIESFPAPRPEPPPSKVLIVHPGDFGDHLPSIFHMESPRRLLAVQAALEHPSLAGCWAPVPARPATEQELAWVHSRAHIARIAATAGQSIRSLDLDTQTSAGSYEVARRAAGAVFSLIDAVWNSTGSHGFAFVRPPGHHAEPDRAMGFCLFNNIALAARYLENVYGLDRIMIVDIDAHHGNGTQKAFYATDTVLFASLHQFPGFPGSGHLSETGSGRGEGFTVNIPLPKGSRDIDFALAVQAIIRPIAYEYEPEVLLVSCGFDLYQHDRLAGMHGTPEGYALMTCLLKEMAGDLCGGRLVFVLEGGYNLRGIETCGLRTLQEMAGVQTLNPDRIAAVRGSPAVRHSVLRKVIDLQKKKWKSLGA